MQRIPLRVSKLQHVLHFYATKTLKSNVSIVPALYSYKSLIQLCEGGLCVAITIQPFSFADLSVQKALYSFRRCFQALLDALEQRIASEIIASS